MKKLFAIALLTLSPLTFAKDFNPDFIVGTWLCKGVSSFENGKEQYTQIAKQKFDKNGTYESKDSTYDKSLDETMKSKVRGKWYVKSNILSMNIEEVSMLSTDKPSYTDVNSWEESLVNNHKFSQFIIEKLSPNKLVSSLAPSAQAEVKGNTIETCYRIKQ